MGQFPIKVIDTARPTEDKCCARSAPFTDGRAVREKYKSRMKRWILEGCKTKILGWLIVLCLYSPAGAQITTIVHVKDGTHPASGNEVVPQNATQVVIELYGGGGGGGVSDENFAVARGGGGGGYALRTIDIDPSDWGKLLPYTRAEKADGGHGPFATAGQAGDRSSVNIQNLIFGSSTPIIANGGEGGSSAKVGSGGDGGTASGGTTNFTGGDADTTGAGGTAAGPEGGRGGAVPTSSGPGDGEAPGGGGAGGGLILGGSGGTGRLGRVIFTWMLTAPPPTPTPTPAATPALPKVTVSAFRTQIKEGALSRITFATNFGKHPDLFVKYSVSGRAVLNVDYALTNTPGGAPGIVVIPANRPSASIVLSSMRDPIRERNPEAVVISVEPGAGYVAPNNKNTRAVITLLDRKG